MSNLEESIKDLAYTILRANKPESGKVWAEAVNAEKIYGEGAGILNKVSTTLDEVAGILFELAEDVKKSSSSSIEEESLSELADLATAFDNSDDPKLHKLASVLDELLLTISTPKGAVEAIKNAEDKEIDKLREKYRNQSLEDSYKKKSYEYEEEAIKEIEKKVKNYKPMEHALSTRYSPDMPGVSLARIGDNVYQCPITKKIYNYTEGYTKMDGDKVPGTNVNNQTQQLGHRIQEHMNFSSRDQVLNG